MAKNNVEDIEIAESAESVENIKNFTYQGLVNISLNTAIHKVDEDGVTSPAHEYRQNYGKSAFFKVDAETIDECADKLQELLDKIGALLTNEQGNTDTETTSA